MRQHQPADHDAGERDGWFMPEWSGLQICGVILQKAPAPYGFT